MRALAAATACALLLGGCAAGAPATPEKAEKGAKVSYNRRELPPAQGLFTGKDGVWTIYRNDAERADAPPAPAPAPAPRETLLCQRGQQCDPPPHE